MTSFNYARFIPYAIESVLHQTFPDLELIIIDDGSSDSSKEIIEEFRKKDPRIRAIFHENNMGIARTMNDGIDAARGKFIAFIASDDLWMADKLDTQLKVLTRDEDLVAWSEGLVIDENGSPTGKTFTQIIPDARRKKNRYIFEELLSGNFILGTSRILKRENLEGIRWNEDLKYLNDYQFAVDLAYKYRFCFIEEPLVCYRVHGRNTRIRDEQGHTRDLQPVYTYFLARYGNEMSLKRRIEIWIRYYREFIRIYQLRRLGDWLKQRN